MSHFSFNAGLVDREGFRRISLSTPDGWMNRWRVSGGEACSALPRWRGCDGQIIEASVQLCSVMAGLRQSASVNGTLRNISKWHPQTGWTRSRCCSLMPDLPIAVIYRNKWKCQNTVWWLERRSSSERVSYAVWNVSAGFTQEGWLTIRIWIWNGLITTHSRMNSFKWLYLLKNETGGLNSRSVGDIV